MKEDRAVARIAGTLFLIAMVSSLVGASLLESALGDADAPIGLGVALEFVDALAVLGIAAALYPVLARGSGLSARTYLSVRILESASLVAAALVPVTIRSAASSGSLLLALRADIHGVLVPLFFIVGSILLYRELYRTAAVPRFISVWGLLAAVALTVGNIAPVPMSVGFVFAAPIILNEIFLGIWLIARGFESMAAPETAR